MSDLTDPRRWLKRAAELEAEADALEARASLARDAAAALRRYTPDATQEARPSRRRGGRRHNVTVRSQNGNGSEAPFGYKADGTPRKRPAPSAATRERMAASRAATRERRDAALSPA